MRAILVDEANKNSAASLHVGQAPDPKCKPHECLVRVKAFGLNRMDLLQRRGLYPLPPGVSSIMGVEFSGIIEQGNDKWKKGTEVFGLASGGAYAELIATPSDLLLEKPKDLSWDKAAAIPENWLTAYQTSRDIGGLQEGETILVHAGASGVGTSAIQLAKSFKASKIFATAGTAEKCKFLEQQLGATKAFNYKEEDWSKGVLEATDNKGVDLILDFIGPNYWEGNIAALARDGRLILIGLMSGTKTKNPIDLSVMLYKRIRIEGTTLRSRSLDYQTQLMGRFAKDALPKILGHDKSDRMDIIVHQTYKAEEIVQATEAMENAHNTGKLICEW